MHRRFQLCVLAVCATALLAPACKPGAKLAARRTGDLSNPPALRREPVALYADICGDGQLTQQGNTVIERRPYLQGTTSESVRVMFTVYPGANGIEQTPLRVTDLEGRLVSAETPLADPSVASGRQYQVQVEGLEPNQTYCYWLEGLSEPAGFRTAPEAGDDTTLRFIAFGDSGSGSSVQRAVRDQMQTVPFELMLHTGDIAYGQGTLGQFERNFFGVYRDMLASAPVFPVPGNHDYETDRSAAYLQVFSLPDNGVRGQAERWYAFDWGNVHFVALDTESLGAEQLAWLQEDLRGNTLPWTVVLLHRPPFSSGRHGPDRRVREQVWPLLEEYGVQLVLSGHDHHYERFQPIGGVTHVLTGGGGMSTRPAFPGPKTAFSEDVLHFVYGEVRDDSMVLHAIDGVGREFDTVRIAR